jgi:hypothetical protein
MTEDEGLLDIAMLPLDGLCQVIALANPPLVALTSVGTTTAPPNAGAAEWIVALGRTTEETVGSKELWWQARYSAQDLDKLIHVRPHLQLGRARADPLGR